MSFKNIRRGINSRKLSVVGVEYLKALIKSAGSFIKSINRCTSFFQNPPRLDRCQGNVCGVSAARILPKVQGTFTQVSSLEVCRRGKLCMLCALEITRACSKRIIAVFHIYALNSLK